VVEFDPKKLLAELTKRPGVYQMLDISSETLYVGKAKNLKNRISSYFNKGKMSAKNKALMAKVADVHVTVTANEAEALLLEQNLIKSLKPAYNILLRDDKSYPYIFITARDKHPAIGIHRGKRNKNIDYFGPFPSATAVRQTLNLLQKSFKVRQCDNNYFRHRTRPCLQYQINRCTGPCVGLVDGAQYAEDVRHTRMFLEGKDQEIINELTLKMDDAAQLQKYEDAAELRDEIIYLRKIQEHQHVDANSGDVDVVAGLVKPIGVCVHVLFIRSGRILGSRTYYPQMPMPVSVTELLDAFVPQFYLAPNSPHDIPRELILNATLTDSDLIIDSLTEKAKRKVDIRNRVRGERARWLKLARTNAEQNLLGHHSSKMGHYGRLKNLQEVLGLDVSPARLECFDISHISGEATVASCVVFDSSGPLKADYRRFNIKDIKAGDDYAAMSQALERRYRRLQSGEGKMPDLLIIDGGKGQLRIAEDVLADLGVSGVILLGIAKGATRKPGLESLFVAGRAEEMVLASDSPALHLIQHIRDEAHRFAISGHRAARGKKRRTSTLEGIPGIGAKRRRALLRFFGGIQEIMSAGEEDIARVEGISKKLAAEIYAVLHND